jgi:PAS domain S-box-containing protein
MIMETTNHQHFDRFDPTGALAEFLEHAPVAIHSVDPGGKILWANRAELDLLGYSADEYIGQPMVRFAADPDVLLDMLERVTRGETLCDRELRLRAKDGSIRHVLINSNMLVQDGVQVGTRCFARDVTEQKRAERDRDGLIADLSRTVRLNDMFAGIVGHDLRGPLSTIVMAGQLLLGYVDDPKGVRTIERMLNSADRMQGMISQLLDFARARADGGIELERRPTEVAEIARDVIEEVRFTRPEWKIDLEVKGDVRGEYDANRLSQVFSNLIGNAVQHGSPDTPLAIKIDGSARAAIHVEVRNRGTIPPELIPILFSPFRGSHQKELRSQGLGLGLFITDHIVRAHGGAIAAESSGGTTAFRFELPRRASGESQVATFDAAAPSPGAEAAAPASNGRSHGPTEPPRDPARDRGRREVAYHQEERFQLLVESVKDYAIFLLDAGGRVATWNAGAQRIMGYLAPEIIGQHFSVFFPEADVRAGKCEHELRVAMRDGRSEDEGWRLRKGGSRLWADVVITALRDATGALLGYAKITRDLTERRQLEEERVRLAHAQEAVRLRDEFLSLASHELKTPLTVLQLQLEAMREQIRDDHAAVAKLERIDRARGRLTELVDALLDVSRIATGQFSLHLEQADAADIVAGAVDRLHETAANAGCALSVTADHAIGTWDRSRIDQIVTNLVSNAIRHAAGSPIAVTVARDARDAVIEVRDTGPGLPEGQLARIFERFERGASMRHFGGLGLGLYVVRQITEAHGGTVTAENTAEGGARFTVRLPLEATRDLVA